jgi:hypothetical protein
MAANLTVGTITTATHPSVPTGNVISQNPLAGWAVEPGSAVDFVISAGPLPDADNDGVPDISDNCTLVPNGAGDIGTAGPYQNDTDGDDYGNMCDPDFNQNGIVDPVDFSLLKTRFGQPGFPDQDLNGNGIVDPVDFSLLKTMFGQPPGPSRLATVANIIAITGEQSPVDGACVAAIPATGGFDCSYDMTDPIGAGTLWSGPVVGPGYYAVGNSPFANGDTTSDSEVGDNKIRVQLYTTDPYASNITIDNGANKSPNCNTSDRIGGLLSLSAATRWFQGGPGQKGEETWGDGMVRIPFELTQVDQATPNIDGGCDYELASIIMPKRLDIAGGVAPDDKYPSDVNVVPGTYVAPSDDAIFCGTDGGGYLGSGGTGTEGNCGAVSLTRTVQGNDFSTFVGSTDDLLETPLTEWQCQDNTNAEPKVCALGVQPTDGACDFDGSHYCGTRNAFENILISISTDSNGDITSGLIFMHNETRIFEVGPPSPDTNSWDGAVYTFIGTCTNCTAP